MDKPYRLIDVSGDVGLEVFGEDLEALFRNAALGLYHLITPTALEVERGIEVAVEGEDLEGLLINWLNELIFLFDARGFIGVEIEFKELKEKALKAEVKGAFFDEERCERGLLVKAATYHGLEIKRDDKGYRAKIIFDI